MINWKGYHNLIDDTIDKFVTFEKNIIKFTLYIKKKKIF